MSAVICRHPTTSQWLSFERRGANWEHSVNAGSLQGIITGALAGLTGVFTWSERGADAVRNVIALEPSDLTRPELRDVSMTILLPVREGDDVWCMLRCLRGETIYAGKESHFRQVNLGTEIMRFFGLLGWEHLESRVRPDYPRELLIRPTGWLATAIAPAEFESAEERRRRDERNKVQADYEAKLRSRDPREKRQRQYEIDQAVLSGTQEARAEAEAERKKKFGFTAAVKIRPDDRTQG